LISAPLKTNGKKKREKGKRKGEKKRGKKDMAGSVPACLAFRAMHVTIQQRSNAAWQCDIK
jgi:hypothetical protein